ncbi:protein kinase [Sorangium cellulosum]|uniref:Protein kinase n=1 Tax=Sorangium cellulosum TaxID=56 RepID=A0A2L0EQQ0_SORCE|nr:bifunctional serine/threonine-protein kinase/formylglycine-generating enzyme family protein [Sorangium cellulosum]AUX41614.1 protein kinase [Sorangium cellulosum]
MSDPAATIRMLARAHRLPPEACAQIERLFMEHTPPGSHEGAPTTEGDGAPASPEQQEDRSPGLLDPAASSPWERFEDLGRIGRGGMGEVRRVRDRVMGRVLAMKILPPELSHEPGARARFLAEARLTACLQHPGIVPVHDCGALPDGRLWFTMKEVRGRTLGAFIRALHADREATPFAEALRRLLDVYMRICEAVAYAHGQGVIHRDLKPANVMLGEFGEVLVMDWGIARAAFEGDLRGTATTLLRTAHATRAGLVMGTPAYMSPEQARGELPQIGPASDVYALGAILYEMLSGRPPYSGTAAAIRGQVVHGPPAPLAERCRNQVPPDLVAICDRAMARSPSHRPSDARVLADEFHRYLDGARRRERARALVEEARLLGPNIERLRAQAESLRAEARAVLAHVLPFDPDEEKARGWALEDEARALGLTAALAEVAWRQKLQAALYEEPDLEEAHAALAEAHLAELRAAEDARDAEATAKAEALLRSHDRGRHAAVLRGDGALTLVTAPDGAEVWLFHHVERQRRLHLEPRGLLGRTPLRGVTLAHGTYVLQIRAPGCREVRYPVRIGRGEHWDGAAPGSAEPLVIPLLSEEELSADDIYVPAGWFIAGGDPLASESLPARRLWVDGFVLRRHPVTQAEYLAFLNDLVERGRGADAAAACPRAGRAIAGNVDVPLFARDRAGRFQPGEHAPAEQARHPIASVDWYGAAAYAAWYAERTGRPWRLVGEVEREKAARGVDGRYFPWGDQVEPRWACMVSSRPGHARPAPVDDYPTDESPYGVRGLAGNVRDWCAELWTPEGPAIEEGAVRVVQAPAADPGLRSIRGGAWSSAPPAMCRAAGRFAASPDERFSAVGLRLARPAAGV